MNYEEKIDETTGEQIAEEDVKITEKDVQKVNKAIKEAQLDATKLSPENQRLFERMLQEADMPIVIQDKDMKIGKQELDVRLLSRANWRQMEFRQLALHNVYLKQIVMGNTDILRMLMVIADKIGVKDIVQATDDLLDKISAQQAEKNKKNFN